MWKPLIGTVTVVAAGVLAAAATPARTADTNLGRVTGTIRVTDAACIRLSATSLDFGAAAFAQPGSGSSTANFDGRNDLTVTNCGHETSQFWVAGSPAFNDTAFWELTDNWYTCDGSLNRYGLFTSQHIGSTHYTGPFVTEDARVLFHRRGPALTPVTDFLPNEDEVVGLFLHMPCVGSGGTGSTMSFTFSLLSVVL